jgi:hypothetical protein
VSTFVSMPPVKPRYVEPVHVDRSAIVRCAVAVEGFAAPAAAVNSRSVCVVAS